MSSQYLRIFQQPRSAILLILGFASGLPLALTSGTLQAWMTVENIDLKTIGFFSLVGQAYVFKFLWSPLMDRYTPPFFFRSSSRLVTAFFRSSSRLVTRHPTVVTGGDCGDGLS
ncbi:AmpG permease [Salmonella enterica subsp. enterica serovar Senftenberg str. A4-543]|uniref:AmpG permease n=1 Tax=Salmonella enterica subsp. enterica serovar Senftenberg str. A4-543 TaxID=913082 RepID=G5QVR1_SALSE|nr:AmpG permease [Salmonella enterica subsp. enterica serovar Senftenberg str. A4-543]